jgi:hypothetical protein
MIRYDRGIISAGKDGLRSIGYLYVHLESITNRLFNDGAIEKSASIPPLLNPASHAVQQAMRSATFPAAAAMPAGTAAQPVLTNFQRGTQAINVLLNFLPSTIKPANLSAAAAMPVFSAGTSAQPILQTFTHGAQVSNLVSNHLQVTNQAPMNNAITTASSAATRQARSIAPPGTLGMLSHSRSVAAAPTVQSQNNPIILQRHTIQYVAPSKLNTSVDSNAFKKPHQSSVLSEDCAICMDPLSSSRCKQIAVCRHVFHTKCIEQALKNSTSCPVCRKVSY